MSFNEIIEGLFGFLEKLQVFLFNFGEIAQNFFDALP